MKDESRQWPGSGNVISEHHLWRYKLAYEVAKGRILDAACGSGYGSSILAYKGVVTGVDFSAQAIGWAEDHFPGPTYIKARIEDEPWEGKFDTVVSLETIEHLKEPETALQAFRRACIGFFVASVPNEELYPFKAENFVNDESPHFRHYTPQEFEELLKRNGFKVLDKFCQKDKWEAEVKKGTDGKFLIYVCK